MGETFSMRVVGDGPVADALVAMTPTLGWDVTVTAEDTSIPDGLDALVVTSHHDGVDGPAIMAALAAGTAYIGAMGSRRTQERRREWLLAQGVAPEALDTVRAPIGLDIGADSPAEIAVSVLAEVVASRSGRATTGSVSDRDGAIHPGLAPGTATCPGG